MSLACDDDARWVGAQDVDLLQRAVGAACANQTGTSENALSDKFAAMPDIFDEVRDRTTLALASAAQALG